MALPRPKKPLSRQAPRTDTRVSDTRQAKSTYHTYQRQAEGTPFRASRFVFFFLLIIVAILWNYRNNLSSFFNNNSLDTGNLMSGESLLFVGKDLSIHGTLERNGSNKYSYTHTLHDEKYGTIGLRSSSVDLYALSGQVALQGKISDFVNNHYILEVDKIIPSEQELEQVSYFSTPGVLFEGLVRDGFTINNNDAMKTIIIDNPSTQAQITMRYFVCGEEKTTNCQQFVDSFQNLSGEQSKDSYGNIFYQLQDKNTWFTTLDDRYGVYIETSHPQLFSFIIEKTQFITLERARKHLGTSAASQCKKERSTLQSIVSSKLKQVGETFVWDIKGLDAQERELTCSLTFSPNNLNSLKVNVEAMQEQTPTEAPTQESTSQEKPITQDTPSVQQNPIPLSNPGTKQFPLKPGKEMLFSTRGLTIVFPSPNISFASSTISEGPEGLSCTSQTNVIEYSKKDELSTNPALSIYFCTQAPHSSQNLYRVISAKDVTLVIQVYDEQRIDFANAISVE